MRLFACSILALLTVSLSTPVHAAGEVSETGTTGMSFLRITPTAQTAALGGGMTARLLGASSVWSNPSLIAFLDDRSAQFTHTSWVEDINHEYFAIATNEAFGSLAFSVQLFDSGDIELRGTQPSAAPLGEYSITNVSLGGTYARTFLDNSLSMGITYKQLFEKISDETAAGYALDVGLTADTPVDNLLVAAAARNYGRMGMLKNERTKLPSDVTLGMLYHGTLPIGDTPFYTNADVLFPRYGDSGVRLGLEVLPRELVALRIGYRSDSDIQDVSFGVGMWFGRFTADVAYTPMHEGFDNALRFTLGITDF